jgi:uncharacterized protein with GYD domain
MQFALIGRLTRESLAAFIKDPIDRSGPASALIETVGGKMQHMWQTPEGVVIIILDAPDAKALTAISTSVQAINRLEDVRIHRLQPTAELIEGIRLAQKAMDVNQFPKQ